jgi:hypothetical protein
VDSGFGVADLSASISTTGGGRWPLAVLPIGDTLLRGLLHVSLPVFSWDVRHTPPKIAGVSGWWNLLVKPAGVFGWRGVR